MSLKFNPFTGTFDYVGTASSSYFSQSFTSQTSVTVPHNFGQYPVVQVIDNTNSVIIPLTIVNNSVNDLTVTFSTLTTGKIILTLGAPQIGSTTRFVTVTQSATPAVNTDITDVASITGLAQAITSVTTNLTGTPVSGQYLMIQITDNGTARAITWGSKFASTNIVLPTTTVSSTLLRVGFQWDTVSGVWQCIAVI